MATISGPPSFRSDSPSDSRSCSGAEGGSPLTSDKRHSSSTPTPHRQNHRCSEDFPRHNWRGQSFGMLPLRPVFDDDQLLGRAAREASKAWANGEPIGRNKYILATTDKALQLLVHKRRHGYNPDGSYPNSIEEWRRHMTEITAEAIRIARDHHDDPPPDSEIEAFMRSALETCYERGTDCHLPRPARTPLDLEIVHSVTLPPDPPRHVRTRRYAAMSSGAATEIITNARARKMAKQPSAESKPGSSTDSGSSTATSSSDTASSPEIKNDSYSPDTSLEVEPEPMGAAGLDLEDKRV